MARARDARYEWERGGLCFSFEAGFDLKLPELDRAEKLNDLENLRVMSFFSGHSRRGDQ